MTTTILKEIGNSIGVMFQKKLLKYFEENSMKLGDTLEISVKEETIILKKQRKARKKARDIAKPLIETAKYKFDREEVNTRSLADLTDEGEEEEDE